MSKLRMFLIDLAIAAVLAVTIVLVLDVANNVISHVALSLAKKITAAGMEVA